MRRNPEVVEAAIVNDEDRTVFGAFLTAARQRSGRSLDEIARTTKITIRQLEALERGRVEALPGGMYRRAILRNYAAAIGLDSRVAVEHLVQTFGAEDSPGHLSSQEREVGKWSSDRGLMVPARSVVGVAASLAVVFVAQFVTRGDSPAPPVPQIVAPLPETAPVTTPDVLAHRSVKSEGGEPSTGTGGNAPTDTTEIQSPVESRAISAKARAPGLVVTSNPEGARVTVNGIAWGFTPVAIRYLPPGDKTIRVTKDGYLGGERRVRIGEEGGTASVQLTLQPRN